MTGTLELLPFEIVAGSSHEVAQKLDDACEWLRSLGIFLPGNRFASYANTIGKYLESNKTPDEEKALHELVHALREAGDLIRIKAALRDTDSEDFLAQLKKAAGGQAYQWNVANDPSRDFVFELSVAARFLHAGCHVDLTGIADLVAHFENRKIYVECKRVKSKEKLLTRTREACKQLDRRLQADGSSRSKGLAAIKVTDALNPAGELQIGPRVDDFQAICNESLSRFIKDNNAFLTSQFAKGQWGILFENSVCGIGSEARHPDDWPFTFCRGATLVYASKAKAQIEEMRRLGERLCDNSFLQ
ncbi:hypothetical protein [Paraburkholderia antibiotica]|uniref:Uncharacterized protein n=1 Tax=Paraburkholderia antibiotica TaxID=2728839 RepID=A0A7Y0A1C9_9BURK|nr:hypothetical protein [Paraburkholderia antibiotica]NML34707.1 hypothetical protein [Paraburkholderia antibiotica]